MLFVVVYGIFLVFVVPVCGVCAVCGLFVAPVCGVCAVCGPFVVFVAFVVFVHFSRTPFKLPFPTDRNYEEGGGGDEAVPEPHLHFLLIYRPLRVVAR